MNIFLDNVKVLKEEQVGGVFDLVQGGVPGFSAMPVTVSVNKFGRLLAQQDEQVMEYLEAYGEWFLVVACGECGVKLLSQSAGQVICPLCSRGDGDQEEGK